MLLNELKKVVDLSKENVVLFSGDEIEMCNCLGSYTEHSIDDRVDFDFCEVIKVEAGIVKGVDDVVTLNILIKE